MTRVEFQAARERLGETLKRLAPHLAWSEMDHLDYGFTSEWRGADMAAGDMIVFSAHAWSWDGAVPEALLTSILENAPLGGLYHLSDPVRPDQRKS